MYFPSLIILKYFIARGLSKKYFCSTYIQTTMKHIKYFIYNPIRRSEFDLYELCKPHHSSAFKHSSMNVCLV